MAETAEDFVVIIPARYASTRLPGKPLLEIGSRSLIRHVCDKALLSQARQVIVATDNLDIADHLKEEQITAVMTSTECQSGTDRIAQAVSLLNLDDDTVVVNLQGDEPFMPPAVIRLVAQALIDNPQVKISTGCEKLTLESDWNNPNVVKVTRDKNDLALYFSRSLIPHCAGTDNPTIFKHLGIYAYRAGYIKAFARMMPCDLEKSEKLEQLRALYNGDRVIVTEIAQSTGIGVDTPEDLETARKFYDNYRHGDGDR